MVIASRRVRWKASTLHKKGDKQNHKSEKPNTGVAAGRGDGGKIRQRETFKQCLEKGNPSIQIDKVRGGGKQHGTKRRQADSQILGGTMEVEVVEENVRKFERCW
ncbi:hypothetical protein TSUD_229190 [Trifolium subterraneum]|uniref:Uncharacterized protein n=1 Tax=Trifolium subterraneum TaxID=3900 RepID=A0A2Z6LLT7_TRISU|nr:hypothetical protein TSUD_229190 [Trifolium subterraneum]